MTLQERNMALMRDIYDSYNNKSIDPMVAGSCDDLVMHEHASSTLPWGGQYRGADAMQQLGEVVASHLDHQEYVCEDMIAQGDVVVSWGRCTTVDRETGCEASFEWMHRVVLRDGKMAEGHEFYDSLSLGEDLGRVTRPET